MKEISGGIAAPAGFKASGIRCGIKKRGNDLALICSEREAVATGVFTTNRVRAAPIKLSQQHLEDGKARAIIINSGNANACTGAKGYEDAKTVVKSVANELGIGLEDVLIASTGVIGKFLPVAKITKSIRHLVESLDYNGNAQAARAILTTDTFMKQQAVSFSADGAKLTIGVMAKGSGMICPLMATMLCFITTDALISRSALERALKDSVEKSFHRITVDGDTSTNDAVFVLANGLAGNRGIQAGSRSFSEFQKALDHITSSMARMIVKDGEGATKVFEIKVVGARSEKEAKKIGFRIANSNLVKTAFSGNSPNWGRVSSAAGSAGVNINDERLSISVGGEQVMKNGCAISYDVRRVKKSLRAREIKVVVDLGLGRKNWEVWTTDLTEKYVRINKGYS